VKVSLTTSTIGAPGRGARVCRSWCFNIDTTVDIRSITTSSHPSRRVQEVEGEATSRPRARQPRCASGHAAATAAAATAAATQRQRSTTTVVMPPPAAGPRLRWSLRAHSSTTHQARMLLRRQPSNGASMLTSSSSLPSTPRPLDGSQFTARGEHQSRHMRTPVAAPTCMPRADCGHVASLAMTDLGVELDRLHSGEDDHTTIEHWRERRCNLDDQLSRSCGRMHDAHASLPDGGLAAQVSATSAGEVRWLC
jgi:hypothetical protein